MKCVSKNYEENVTRDILSDAERTYSISIREDIKAFLVGNSGGYPIKDIITSNGEDYEVRVFLSLDDQNEYYCIRKPLDYFLGKTKGKIIPIGIDSGDNYYCVNNETGKVYFWSAGENLYFCIATSLDVFERLFD